MKILTISSSYGTGGYGQLCEEVCGLLSDMGHEVRVLTCPGENPGAHRGVRVDRTLLRDPDWGTRVPGYVQFFRSHGARMRHGLDVLKHALQGFSPDVVFVWQGTGLDRALFSTAQHLGYPVAYRLCDYWPSIPDEYCEYWSRLSAQERFRFLKKALAPLALRMLRREGKPIPLDYDWSICVSEAVLGTLRARGIPLREAVTIYNGIELQDFLFPLDQLSYPRSAGGTLSMLYGGDLFEHKGVHVAIEAMRYLPQGTPDLRAKLTVLGEGPPSYVSRLHRLVHQWHLEDSVQFLAPVSRDRVSQVLRDHDILVFPSLYEEPLSRMMQEAMAAGVVVVGTITGGSKEILQDGINALVVEAGDAAAIAAQIRRLRDGALYWRLARAAQNTAIETCDVRRTTRALQAYLEKASRVGNERRNAHLVGI